MISVGDRGSVEYQPIGSTAWIYGEIDSWASGTIVCIRQADGSIYEINKNRVRFA